MQQRWRGNCATPTAKLDGSFHGVTGMLTNGRSTKRASATSRARHAWREMALQTRSDVRTIGLIRGPLPQLDRHVVGKRGVVAPDQLQFIFTTLRDGGVPIERTRDIAGTMCDAMIDATYAEDPNRGKVA